MEETQIDYDYDKEYEKSHIERMRFQDMLFEDLVRKNQSRLDDDSQRQDAIREIIDEMSNHGVFVDECLIMSMHDKLNQRIVNSMPR